MAVICPRCHQEGKRVEMASKRISSDPPAERDRFPREPVTVPAVHVAHTEWNCPVCWYREVE